MRDLVPKEVLTSDLLDHPAVQAWRELQPDCLEPAEIQTLKRSKSAVYRLVGVGPEGSSLIAKRCRVASALTEYAIYKQVLPRLSLPVLRCYGILEDADPDYRWLFVEDAGTQPFQRDLPEHRTLFAHWLATLHTTAEEIEAATDLPERGPAHFLEHLRLARARIQINLANPALTAADLVWVEQIVALCDLLEARWDHMETFCQGMPWTFVHCDLKKKNVRVRQTEAGPALMVFDWEKAGWGVTGPDVMQCADLEEYRSVAERKWPNLNALELGRVFQAGVVFRMLAEIHWETSHLKYEWMERPRLSLPARHQRLADAMRSVGIDS